MANSSASTGIVYVADCSFSDEEFVLYEIQTVQRSLLSARSANTSDVADISGALIHSGVQEKFGVYLQLQEGHIINIEPHKKESPWFCSVSQEITAHCSQYQYQCIYTDDEHNLFLNKAYQVLVLSQFCSELLPKTVVYSSELATAEVVAHIKQNFNEQEIVLKGSLTANGRGNYFGLQGCSNYNEIEQAIETIKRANNNQIELPHLSSKLAREAIKETFKYDYCKYDYLAQESKHLEKSGRDIAAKGYNTYRLLIFSALKENILHIVPIRKYKSDNFDSHGFFKEKNYFYKSKSLNEIVQEKIKKLSKAVHEYDSVIKTLNPQEFNHCIQQLANKNCSFLSRFNNDYFGEDSFEKVNHLPVLGPKAPQ